MTADAFSKAWILAKGEEKSMAYMDKGKKRGLWDNVHAKRKRGEKAAKPGDKDYPDKKNWDKLTNKSYECDCNACVTIHNILEKKEKDDKPFHGYNPNKHSRKGGLNAKGRAKAKKEGSARAKFRGAADKARKGRAEAPG